MALVCVLALILPHPSTGRNGHWADNIWVMDNPQHSKLEPGYPIVFIIIICIIQGFLPSYIPGIFLFHVLSLGLGWWLSG